MNNNSHHKPLSYLDLSLPTSFSVEFYPVLSEDRYESFVQKIIAYQRLGIKHLNITCKPNNSQATRTMVKIVREHSDIRIIPHLVAYKLTEQELDTTLQEYVDLRIQDVFVIRGDMDMGNSSVYDPAFPRAIDLVKQIKTWDSSFTIGVAGYPETHFEETDAATGMRHLYDKISAGADYIITQLFFDNNYFYTFMDLCTSTGITVPIIPGLTYLKNKEHVKKITSLSPGTKVPPLLLKEINNDNHSIGEEWLTNQVQDLYVSERCNTIHMYAFNSLDIFQNILQKYCPTS